LKKWYGKWYVDFKKVNTTVSKIEKGKKQKEAYEILLMNYKIEGLGQLKNIDLHKYKIAIKN